jgi:hypothetical protein
MSPSSYLRTGFDTIAPQLLMTGFYKPDISNCEGALMSKVEVDMNEITSLTEQKKWPPQLLLPFHIRIAVVARKTALQSYFIPAKTLLEKRFWQQKKTCPLNLVKYKLLRKLI